MSKKRNPTPKRVYIVTTPAGETLVRAFNRTQAIAHATKKLVSVRVPTGEELFAAGANGLKLEDAGGDEAEAAQADLF